MSYFRRPTEQSLASNDRCTIQDVSTGEEVAPGVTIERRSLFRLSAAAVGAMLAASANLRGQGAPRSVAAAVPGTDGKLSFEDFLKELLPLARRVADSKGESEEAYLMTVAAAMCRLQEPGAPLRDTMREFHRQHAEDGKQFPLMAVSMRLKPGGGFPHHDHWNYNGVIMGIEGEARIRNYHFQGDVPPFESTETFTVRMVSDDVLLPGRISTLGRSRDNIHDVVAGKDGARVLDVFTFFEPDATSRNLDVEDQPRDAEARIYEAAWRR